MLARLKTLRGHLPQGAPTSDALANHVLAPVDGGLIAIVTALDLKLSRYLDNIDLSGARTREAIPLVIALLREHGYAVRHKKTFNAGPRSARVVTGYTVNNRFTPSVARREQRRIRSAAHELVRETSAGRQALELAQRGFAVAWPICARPTPAPSRQSSVSWRSRTSDFDVARFEA